MRVGYININTFQGFPSFGSEIAVRRYQGSIGQVIATVGNVKGARQISQESKYRIRSSEASCARFERYIEQHWNKGQRDKCETTRVAEQQ